MGALPAGWIDTGITQTFTLEVDISLRAQVGTGSLGSQMSVRIGNTDAYLRTRTFGTLLGRTDLWIGTPVGLIDTVGGADTIETILVYGPSSTIVVLNSGTGPGAVGAPSFLPKVHVTKTLGPLRLGVTIEDRSAVSPARGSVLRYAWFTDASTNLQTLVGATVVENVAYTDPATISFSYHSTTGLNQVPTLGLGQQLQVERTGWGNFGSGETGSSVYTHVRFEDFFAQAAAVIPNTPQEFAQTLSASGPTFYSLGPRWGVPWKWKHDLAAFDADGTAETVDATYDGARTTPSNFDQRRDWISSDNISADLATGYAAGEAVLADPWLSAQTIQPRSADQTFVNEGNDPETPANSAVTEYNVGSLTITASVGTIFRSTNAFVGAGAVVVSGPTNTPTFTVSGAGASVTKTMLEKWRDWNDSLSGDYHADDGYTTTKADYYGSDGQDIWGWGLYAYLDVTWTAAVAATLVHEVTWVVAGPSPVQVVRTYTKAVTGAGTYRLDLLFPDEGETPFYGERVDSVKISGFAVGTYALGAVNLVAVEDSYLKIGGVFPSVGASGGITIAQDGQMSICQWSTDPLLSPSSDTDGDGVADTRRDHQNGRLAYAASESDPESIASYGGAIGMTQTTIQQVIEEAHRMEGVTATYSATALNAALGDGFGNTIGIDASTGVATPVTRSATWLTPTLPHVRVTPGTPYTIMARIVVDEVVVPNARVPANFRLFQRMRLGAALEAQGKTTASARAGAGATVNARVHEFAPSAGDPIVGSGTTDASGFVTVPVRTGFWLNGLGNRVEVWHALDGG